RRGDLLRRHGARLQGSGESAGNGLAEEASVGHSASRVRPVPERGKAIDIRSSKRGKHGRPASTAGFHLIRRVAASRAAVAVAIVALAASYFAASADTRGQHRRVYWGAWIGSQLTGTAAPWDMNAVSKFERI